MTVQLRGIDWSHHQKPELADYATIAAQVQFAILRATYGITPDRETARHVRGFRHEAISHGLGLYHFLRPDQPVQDQLEAFERVALSVALAPGDIVPTIDVERYPEIVGRVVRRWIEVQPGWSDPLLELAAAFRERWGACLIYLSPSDWVRLGKPSELLAHLLWIAHWGVSAPCVPDGWQWRLWQQGARKLDGFPKAVDFNVAIDPLPRIPYPWMSEAQRWQMLGLAGETARLMLEELRGNGDG